MRFFPPSHSVAKSLTLAASSLALSLTASSAASYTWSGSSTTSLATGANYFGGTAPVLTGATSTDTIEFTGVATPPNQATWGLGATNSIGGLVTGDNYATSLTLNAGSAARTIDLGASGITTGSTLFTLTGSVSGATPRNISLQLNSNQTWNIGSGGMQIVNAGTGSVVASGTGTLTKDGAGTVTWATPGGNITNLIIKAGGMVTTGNSRFVNNGVGNTITLDGPTALIAQNGSLSSTSIVINGGGTYQTTGGPSNSWNANNQFSGTGAFTIDVTTVTAPTSGGLVITGTNSGYTGSLTLKMGGSGTNPINVTVSGSSASALGDGTASTHGLTLNSIDTISRLAIGGTTVNATALSLTVGTLNGNASSQIIATATNTTASSTFTVNQFNTGTYAGTMSNAGSGAFNLVKNQTGTLVLAGSSSSWTKGSVTINAGTMLVAANSALGSSPVTVALSGGTLASDATGRTLNNVVTSSGTASTIRPTGNFTLGGLNAASGVTLNLDSTETLSLTNTLTGATATGSFILDLTAGFTTGSAVTIINFGAASGVDASDFSLSAAASSLYSLSNVTIDGDSVDITLSAVPEPSTAALLLGGGGALLWVVRRRRTA